LALARASGRAEAAPGDEPPPPLSGDDLWAAGDVGDAVVFIGDGRLYVGEIAVSWAGGPAGPPIAYKLRRSLALTDVPTDLLLALAFLGPVVEERRAAYRRRFFRCANCRQRLPPSHRPDGATG
jgi:hypothetical protein